MRSIVRGRNSVLRTAVVAVFLFVTAVYAQTKENSKPQNQKDLVTSLEIVVTGGDKNVPVDNASVYLRWEESRFLRHARQMEFDLKTNQAGVAKVKDVPRIKILIQIVKTGWKPFGQYYELNKDEQKIEIKLDKPPRWY